LSTAQMRRGGGFRNPFEKRNTAGTITAEGGGGEENSAVKRRETLSAMH